MAEGSSDDAIIANILSIITLLIGVLPSGFEKKDIVKVTRLDLSGKNLRAEDLPDLAEFPLLQKLNIKKNKIEHLNFLRNCKHLVELCASDNPLSSLDDVEELTQLQTVIVSNCKLFGTLKLDNFKCLRTLIATSNSLTDLSGLGQCPDLTTLVVSGNNLSSPSFLSRQREKDKNGVYIDKSHLHLPVSLRKLSLSHNNLSRLSRGISRLHALRELRANDNNLRILPPPSVLKCLRSLSVLDIGKNNIGSVAQLAPSLSSLRNLNLRGNPITHRKDYPDCIFSGNLGGELAARLEILDGRKRNTSAIVKGMQRSTRKSKKRQETSNPSSFREEKLTKKSSKRMDLLRKDAPHSSEDGDSEIPDNEKELLAGEIERKAIEELGLGILDAEEERGENVFDRYDRGEDINIEEISKFNTMLAEQKRYEIVQDLRDRNMEYGNGSRNANTTMDLDKIMQESSSDESEAMELYRKERTGIKSFEIYKDIPSSKIEEQALRSNLSLVAGEGGGQVFIANLDEVNRVEIGHRNLDEDQENGNALAASVNLLQSDPGKW
eukprot:CAMPEP_0167756802 /NCGR_PEP_ID=MMETSP0110_2-20121227/9582_1 /TAXON_ID=629695 /ORGANISM="Gymnochlora sp., Strain CCMP2014" /LENGTH=550 /DNA_ID=CAMNT_0007642941 /DNA_START=47 /DNA_END=1697 /DNA_ORIENTATION=-